MVHFRFSNAQFPRNRKSIQFKIQLIFDIKFKQIMRKARRHLKIHKCFEKFEKKSCAIYFEKNEVRST